jgi:putative ABC transport system permease protein
MRIPLSSAKYAAGPISLTLEPMLSRITGLPGVQSAGVITYLPMQSYGTTSGFQIQGKSSSVAGEEPWAEVRAVSPGYHRVMGIGLLRGRLLTQADSAAAPGVAVVNRTFANHYFPGEDALGKQINFRDEQRWATIVGVVEDTRQAGLESDTRPETDLPYSQTRWRFLTATMSLAVRTDQDPISMSRAVEEAIRSVEPEQGVFAVSAMTSVIAQTETDKRFVMWLLALFAGLALVLAASGLFGQMSYAVTRRMHEIGLRIALGAERSDVLKLVLVDGVKLAALGLAIGLAASLTLTRLMASLLYAVKPAAPSVIVGAALLLAAVALLACYIPVRRATAVDPVAALRHE